LRFRLNIKYLRAFIIILIIEAIIAVFIHDHIIRPYGGDVLIAPLIYCLIRSLIAKEIKPLPLYIFIFLVLVEIGQYFNLARLLGLGDYRIARIILGATFDLKDIVCYLAGCAGLCLYEMTQKPKPL
jgi:hypothetical protein